MRAPRRALLGLSYLAFVSLGLPDAVLGVAWPTLHLELGVDRAALGAVLTSAGAAYVVSGLLSGQLIQRWGTGALLSASTLSVTLGLVGYALAPRWAVFLIAALFVGAGSGAIDAGLNGYAARTFPPRQMSWLHAAYSVGAAIGPALMTIFVATARGWRGGYAVLAATLGALSLVFLSVRRAWESPGGGAARADELLPPPPAGRPPAPTHRGRAAGAGAILPPPPAGWPPALAHEGHAASAGAGAILPPPPAGWPPAPAHRGHAPSADELLPPPPAGRPPAPAHRGHAASASASAGAILPPPPEHFVGAARSSSTPPTASHFGGTAIAWSPAESAPGRPTAGPPPSVRAPPSEGFLRRGDSSAPRDRASASGPLVSQDDAPGTSAAPEEAVGEALAPSDRALPSDGSALPHEPPIPSALAPSEKEARPAEAPRRNLSALSALRQPGVLAQLLLFFVYAGVEVAAGQWSYTVLVEGRGLSRAVAGAWATGYWVSLLSGRVLLGFVVERLGTERLIRLASASAAAGALLFALPGLPVAVGGLGLVLLGFSLAPIFPGLLSETPHRVGEDASTHAIGFQVSVATLGMAAIPSGAGLLANAFGLGAIGWTVFAGAAIFLAAHEAFRQGSFWSTTNR